MVDSDKSIDSDKDKELNVPIWVIALGVIVIILIGVGAYLRFFYTFTGDTTIEGSNSKYVPNVGWGPATPINSVCSTYQFPATMITAPYTCGNETQYEGNYVQIPSVNLDALGNLDALAIFQNCVDSDQLNAVRVTQSCDQIYNISNDDRTSWCFDQNGVYYTYGQTIDYFTYCNVTSTLQVKTDELLCPGTIGGLSVGFQSQSFSNLPCMKYDDSTKIFVPVPLCDLTDSTQIFRIMRTHDLNNVPSASSNPTGNDGPYIALIYRDTGQCVVPTTRYPDKAGYGLTLDDPSLWNNGFIWYLVPPLNYTIEWDGNKCVAETPCNKDISGNPVANNPPGCTTDPLEGVTSSQQLVYIGGASKPGFQLNSRNTMEIVTYLQDTTSNFTYAVNNDGNNITLQTYQPYGNNCVTSGGTNHTCNAANSAINFATYQLYNTLAATCNWFNSGTGC